MNKGVSNWCQFICCRNTVGHKAHYWNSVVTSNTVSIYPKYFSFFFFFNTSMSSLSSDVFLCWPFPQKQDASVCACTNGMMQHSHLCDKFTLSFVWVSHREDYWSTIMRTNLWIVFVSGSLPSLERMGRGMTTPSYSRDLISVPGRTNRVTL